MHGTRAPGRQNQPTLQVTVMSLSCLCGGLRGAFLINSLTTPDLARLTSSMCYRHPTTPSLGHQLLSSTRPGKLPETSPLSSQKVCCFLLGQRGAWQNENVQAGV